MKLDLKIKSALLFAFLLQINGIFASITPKDLKSQQPAILFKENKGQVHEQQVKTISLNRTNHHQISISNLAAGIYFIVGRQNHLIVKQKIIVTN
ncbi:MAG: hypothetical protein Q8L81_16310 [Bacteroidota bacterium]|nr:hypothetical protein [Bacteroidota bacterium]